MSAALDSDAFRRACGLWATGVSIVTTVDSDARPYGLTMNAVTSLSLAPPQFLVCVDHGSDTLAPLKQSGAFCINLLTDQQQDLSNNFAKKNPDKFADVGYTSGATGAPRLDGALLAIDCSVSAIHPGGDHDIVVGKVVELTQHSDLDNVAPLIYFKGRYADLQ